MHILKKGTEPKEQLEKSYRAMISKNLLKVGTEEIQALREQLGQNGLRKEASELSAHLKVRRYMLTIVEKPVNFYHGPAAGRTLICVGGDYFDVTTKEVKSLPTQDYIVPHSTYSFGQIISVLPKGAIRAHDFFGNSAEAKDEAA